jgi:RsiW-degrading membrane proteinase PrsW (M82 family)
VELLQSFLLGFIPMLLFAWVVYWVDRYEKEPVILLSGVFLFGAVIAAGAAFIINTLLGLGVFLFTQSQATTDLTTGALIAPIVEESLKAVAILIVFLVFSQEFDSILDGIVYASIVALGFAATENVFYIYRYGFLEQGYQGLLGIVFIRVVLVGWQHPFYTSFTGIGLAAARLNRSLFVKLFASMVGLTAAIFTHSIHNTLATLLSGNAGLLIGTAVDWTGWFFMLLILVWAILREQRNMRFQLLEEVQQGIISPHQYKVACSAWSQTATRLSALLSGRYHSTSRFYQICAELAHKKRQLMLVGDEKGNSILIERLRQELAVLAPKAA